MTRRIGTGIALVVSGLAIAVATGWGSASSSTSGLDRAGFVGRWSLRGAESTWTHQRLARAADQAPDFSPRIRVTGCASTKVSDRQVSVTEKIPQPDHILVYDFVAHHGRLGAAILGRIV